MPYLSHIYLNFSQFLLNKAQNLLNGFIYSIRKRSEKENAEVASLILVSDKIKYGIMLKNWHS